MASDDMVFVETGPSMQLMSSPSDDSGDTRPTSSLKGFPHAYSPASPTITGPSLGCNPCGLAFRPKSGFAPYPSIPKNSTDLNHCCHGGCGQKDELAKIDESYRLPPQIINIPPPPVENGSTSPWFTPNSRAKVKKAVHASSPLGHVSYLSIL